MTTEIAPKNYEELEKLLADDDRVKVAGIDVDGVLRGKIMAKSKFLSSVKSEEGGFGFCSVIFGWDIHDKNYSPELSVSNEANGYGDLLARIDINTYRRMPFEKDGKGRHLPFFFVTFIDPATGEELHVCPRGTLQRVLAEVEKEGYHAFAGAEFEYFQFKETPESAAEKGFRDLVPLTKGMHGYSMLRTSINQEYFHDIFDKCSEFGIPIEGHHTETGPGVYETALAYTDAMRMADNGSLFKLTAKTVGLKYGIIPTFMAKPYNDLPGCSGHVHISLRDAKTGENIFASKEARSDAKWSDMKHITPVAEHFIAGVLKGLPDIMPCLVPTVNGYKRLVENYWAPVNVSWGYESRLASVRIISPPIAAPSATRLEVRVPGADMNPHFAFSAILALGLHGIRNKLALDVPPVSVPEGVKGVERLAKSLHEATAKMAAKDSLARQALGDAFVDHFVGTREHEWRLFSQRVTDWEVARYLELA